MKEITEYLRKNVKVIGLSGKAGVGKDYIAKNIFQKEHGFYNIAYAWHMKINCIAFDQASFTDVFDVKPPEIRNLLQIRGTEKGRDKYGYDIWCDVTVAWMMLFHKEWGIDKFVVTDIRFPNEAQYVKDMGGKVYRVVSDIQNRHITKKAQSHRSEVSLTDDSDIYDGYLYNDISSGNLDHVKEQIDLIMEDI